MSERRLLAVITAMLLVGSPAQSQQAASLEDLYELEELIVGKDCLALFSFVLARPYLLEGEDVLATELGLFVDDVQQGNVNCFGANTYAVNNAPPGAEVAADTAASTEIAVTSNSITQPLTPSIY